MSKAPQYFKAHSSIFAPTITPSEESPQEVIDEISASRTFHDSLEMQPSSPQKHLPMTPDALTDYCFFESPETPSMRPKNAAVESTAQVRTCSTSPPEFLRPRKLVWQSSVRQKNKFSKNISPTVRLDPNEAVSSGTKPRADELWARLGPLSSLFRPRSTLQSSEPLFKVVVPTSQEFNESLTLDDCDEIAAASPYYGLYLLCKRLSIWDFDPSTAPDPKIKVPLSILHYIESELCKEDPNNFEDWMLLASSNGFERFLSTSPIQHMLEMLGSSCSTKDGALLVSRIALEDLALKLVACWPQSIVQDDAFKASN